MREGYYNIVILSHIHTCTHAHTQKTRDLALHCEGAKLVVESENPHLVGIDPDILSTGLVFFYLKVWTTMPVV